jgi:hypothetical protein
LEDTPTPVWMHFCVHHRAVSMTVETSLSLHRLRLGVVPTYYPVNSWPSRSSRVYMWRVPVSIPPHPYRRRFQIASVETRFWRFYKIFPVPETHQFRYRYASSPPTRVHRCIGSRNGTRQTLPTSAKLTSLSMYDSRNDTTQCMWDV